MKMYQLEILEEEAILKWFSTGATNDKSRQLRKNQGVSTTYRAYTEQQERHCVGKGIVFQWRGQLDVPQCVAL